MLVSFNGKLIKLNELSADAVGAEAAGHTVVGHKHLFATRYHPTTVPDGLEWWEEFLREATRDCPYTAKSIGVIRDVPKGPATGVMWLKANGKPASVLFEEKENMPKGKWARINFLEKLLIGFKSQLEHGIIHTDPHLGNIFRDRWNNPTIIDMLSFSTVGPVGWHDGTFAKKESRMVNPDFLAPELISNNEHTAKTLDHSMYVLAHVVLKDDFPFDTLTRFGTKVDNKELRDNELYGRFTDPVTWAELNQHTERYSTPDNGIPWAEIHEEVQWLFNQAFVRGRLVPSTRPTLDELLTAIKRWKRRRLMKTLAVCGGCTAPLIFMTGMLIGGEKGPWLKTNNPPPLKTEPAPVVEKPKPNEEPDPNRPSLWNGK